MKSKKLTQGFTLLEILLVVGIIAILAGIVIVAINPSKQLAQVRNTERKSDIKQLDSAITQYYIDTFNYPSDITSTLTEVCNTGSISSTTDSIYGNPCTNLINLSSLVPDYITAIPVDPQATSAYDGTGYYLKEDSTTHKLITQADLAELDQTIAIGVAGSTTEQQAGGCDATCISDLRTGLVAYYPFNGDAIDDAGSYDGTWLGTETYAGGKLGQAASFDGLSGVNTGASFINGSAGDFSIAFWSYVADVGNLSNQPMLISQDDQSSCGENGMFFILSPGSEHPAYFTAQNCHDWSQVPEINPLTTQLNGWHYIVITRSGTSLSLYLDGGSPVDTATDNRSFSNNISFVIGNNSQSGYGLDGKMDEVAIWSRVLDQTDIDNLYNNDSGLSLVQ